MLATLMHSMAMPLGVVAAVACAIWLIAMGIVVVVTRPRRPEPVMAGLELGGDAPPAVAAAITNDLHPRPVGAAATLIDLAARRIVHFEPIDSGGYQVRVAPGHRLEDLIPFEAHVMHLVKGKANNGVAPCTALQLPEGDATEQWFKTFDRLVMDEARSRGLSRSRITKRGVGLIKVSGAIVAATVGIAAAAALGGPPTQDCTNCSPGYPRMLVWAAAIGWIAWIGLMLLLQPVRDVRDTPEGRAEASRWLGLRAKLREDPVLCSQHVDAVTTWGRLLAYGIAFGDVHVAAHDVPISAESRQEAWSAETGTWRLVRITYPRHLPPGYGEPTWRSLLMGVVHLATVGAVLGFGAPHVAWLFRDVTKRTANMSSLNRMLIHSGLRLAVVVVAVTAVVVVVRAAFMVWFAANDLFATQVIEGRVIRSYERTARFRTRDTWESAIDDGSTDHLRALRGRGYVRWELQEGCHVRATITRHLRTLKSVEVLAPGVERRPIIDPSASSTQCSGEGSDQP